MRCRKAKCENALAAACGLDLLFVRRHMVCTIGPLPAFFSRWQRGFCRLPTAARASYGMGCWSGYAIGRGGCTHPVSFQSTRTFTGAAVDWPSAARTRVAFNICVASTLPRRAAQRI